MYRPNNRTLVMLLAAIILFAACKKKLQPPEGPDDGPLATQDYPSIIINSNNQIVYAINPSNGTKNWELGLPTPLATPTNTFAPSPLLYKNRLYIASGNDNNDTLYKVNPRTGAIIKKIDVVTGGGTTTIQATPIADGSMVYVAGYDGWLYAIDTGSGDIKWKYQADGPMVSTPTINGNQIYFATTAGSLYSVDKNDGTMPTGDSLKWSITIPGASFFSSPAVGSPYIFVGSGSLTDSNMYCLNLKTGPGIGGGTVRWAYKTQGAIFSSPACYQGKVIFGCNDFRVYCLDTFVLAGQSGPSANWVDSFASEVYSSPYVSGQTVFVGCKDYKTYALALLDGKVKWSHQSNGVIKSSPICYKGLVYIGGYDKMLYALDSAKGTPKWVYPVNGQILCSPVIDDLSGTNAFSSGISGMTTYGPK